MKKRTLFLLPFLLLYATVTLTALDPNKAVTQYQVDLWNMDRGFPTNLVSTMAQTDDGYLWLGSPDGLIRFDGVRFKVYNGDNTPQLKDSNIRKVYKDSKGILWIGTNTNGIVRLKNNVFNAYTVKENPSLYGISSICEGPEGGLWIGTYKNGVSHLKNGKITPYRVKDGLISDTVYAIETDNAGNLWFAAPQGITRRTHSGQFSKYSKGKNAPFANASYPSVFAMCKNENGVLWLSGYKNLCRREQKGFVSYDAGGLPNPKLIALCFDSACSLWIGTDGGGLARMRNREFETLSKSQGLPSGFIYSFLEDREGSLWIGTLDNGLLRLRDTKFTNFTTREGLSSEIVECILEDRYGNLWIGTRNGLNCIKKGKLLPAITTKNGLLTNKIHCILEDKNEGIWIGTNNGLNLLRNGMMSVFNTENGLIDSNIISLYQDPKGHLWIGTEKGLNSLYKGKIIPISANDQGLNTSIFCIYKDKAEQLWVGTKDGLFRANGETNSPFVRIKGLMHHFVHALYEDDEGALYIATSGGLSKIKKGKLVNYVIPKNLIAKNIKFVAEDSKGNLWLAGNQGLVCVNKKELEDFSQNKIQKIHPVSYNEGDGMKNRWIKRNSWLARDGKLWLATNKGVAMIDTGKVNINKQPPPVIIENLKYDGQKIDIGLSRTGGQERSLIPGTKRLEFSYTAISFLNPQKIKFKIKLMGYDKDWLDNGNSRNTVYTNLSPGHYSFRVIACNSDGIWNNTGASFPFYLKPYFYQTTWFYILVAFFTVVVVFSSYRFRVRNLVAREKKLTALVDARTQALNERTLQLEESYKIIETKNQNILSSIQYAGKIQQAILPGDESMNRALTDFFVIFKPRDIVSGDFYWLYRRSGCYFIAVADCTGHGVPGALLSMIGGMRLNEIMTEMDIKDPAEILDRLHTGVRSALKQEEESQPTDGMDVALCMLDLKKGTVTFAGAKRPLIYIKNSTLHEIKGDRKSIGGRQRENKRTFSNHTIIVDKDTAIYLTSDGFVDQNNEDGKKYGSKKLKQFLRSHAHLDMETQKWALLEELKTFRAGEEQRDDITVMAIKLTPPRELIPADVYLETIR